MMNEFIAAYDSMGDVDTAMLRVWDRLSAEAEELGVELEIKGARSVHLSKSRRTLPIAAVIATLLIAAVYAIGFFGLHKQFRDGRDKAAADPGSGFQAMSEPGDDGDAAGLIIVGEDSALPAIERIAVIYTSPSGDMSAELGDNLKSPEQFSPTMFVGESLHLTAQAYPAGAAELAFTWSSSDESAIRVAPTEDGGCDIECIGTHSGGVVITVQAGEAEGRCRIYTVGNDRRQ